MERNGPHLKALRTARNINQADAAASAGISRSHLSKIEGNQDPASLEVYALLAVAYRLPLGELLPAGHPLKRVELVVNADELALLHYFRSLPVEEAHALARAFMRRNAA